jgi:hypothetical protein
MAAVKLLFLGFLSGIPLLASGCDGQTVANEPLRPAPATTDFRPPIPPPKVEATAPKAAAESTSKAPEHADAVPVAMAVPLNADKFTAHTPRTMTYDTEKGTTPKIVVQEAVPTCHCAGLTWWVRYYAGDTTQPAEREVHFKIDVNGYISETEEIDRLEKVEVEYSPALVLVPDKLPPKSVGSAVFEQEVTMVVHPLGDRSKVKAHGKAKNTIVFEGDERVHTGAGEFSAHRLTATVTADLSAAKTVDVTEQWLVDGMGVVIQRDHEDTRVMGARIRENNTMLILKSFDAGK